MTHARLDHVIAQAIAAGILPAGSSRQSIEHRPWPVMLLTGIGAWLAAIPLIAIMFVTLQGELTKGVTPYLIGVVLVAGSVLVLRKKDAPLFAEQMAIPALLTGGFMLGTALHNDVHAQVASAVLAILTIGTAVAIPRQWLRILLGGAACVMTISMIVMQQHHPSAFVFWTALHVVLAAWIAASWRAQPRMVDAIASGWVLTVLAGLAIWSGVTFLAGASLYGAGGGGRDYLLMRPPFDLLTQATSASMAGAAVSWIALRWPALRTAWGLVSAAVLIWLAWLMPSLGAVLLILAMCAVQQRWKTTVAAGVAAAWIIGAFYYHLSLPLATKALIMVAAGSVLGASAWFAARGQNLTPAGGATPADPGSERRARIAVATTLLLVLAVANFGIMQKETLIANGKPVFIELGPVDPRSLMQGDYMRLSFALPREQISPQLAFIGTVRPRVVGTVDLRGVFTPRTAAAGARPRAGEIAVELTRSGSGWTIAGDAWYFKEGEAARWSKARYGEFRVDEQGKVLLVGLRGPALEPL